MGKIVKILFIFIGLLVLFAYEIAAEEPFLTEVEATYEVREGGEVAATYDFAIENATTEAYVESFSFTLTNISPAKIRAFDERGELGTKVIRREDETAIEVTFPEAVVGKRKQRVFKVEFVDKSLVKQTGEVWEVTVPKGDVNFNRFLLQLIVPSSFQAEAFISPRADKTLITSNARVYIFSGQDVQKEGVTAAFGTFQIYRFDLDYVIENPLSKEQAVTIAIPPDTAFQKIIYEAIEPAPLDLESDPDGNWLATYTLKARQKLKVEARGHVQLFAAGRPFFASRQEVLEQNIKEDEFWEAGSEKIKKISRGLFNPLEIYQYVAGSLSYTRPSIVNKRLGALAALEADNVTAEEFADLFVTLTRANNIPARRVVGWVDGLPESPLHTWAEYFDESKNVWLPADPTLAALGSGTHFGESDLRHITFVVNGTNSERPLSPGASELSDNPEESVDISLSSLPIKRDAVPEISTQSTSNLFVGNRSSRIKISNPGPVALYSRSVEVLFDGGVVDTILIPVLLPFDSTSVDVAVPVGILGSASPDSVVIRYAGVEHKLATDKYTQTVTQLVILLSGVLVVSVIIGKKTGFIRLGWRL